MTDATPDIEVEEKPNNDETHARRIGWKPKDEYAGDPDKWCDAKEFLDRAQRNGGLAMSNARRLQDQLDRMQKTLDDQTSAHKTLMDAQAKRIHKEYQDKMRQAVKDGDVEEFDRLEAARTEDLEAVTPKKKDPEPEQPPEPPEVAAFREANPWYQTDPIMTAAATAYSQSLMQSEPNLSVSEHLRKVRQKMADRFPQEFAGENDGGDPPPPDVEGGRPRRGAGGKKKAETYENMPAADQAACDRAVKVGMVKDRDMFVKSYWDIHRDD